MYSFSAVAGGIYRIAVTGVGVTLDVVLTLDGPGQPLITRDQFGTGFGETIYPLNDPFDPWLAPATGTYFPRVTDFNGESGCPTYEYDVAVAQP